MFNIETKRKRGGNNWTQDEVDALQKLAEYHPYQSGTTKSKWHEQLAFLHNAGYCQTKNYKRNGRQIKYGLSKTSTKRNHSKTSSSSKNNNITFNSNTNSKCTNSTTNHYVYNKLETNSSTSTTNSIPSSNDDQSRSSPAVIQKPTFMSSIPLIPSIPSIPSIPNGNNGSLSSIPSYSCSHAFSRGYSQFPYPTAYTNSSSLSSLQSQRQSSTMGFSQSIDGNVMTENNINFEYRKR